MYIKITTTKRRASRIIPNLHILLQLKISLVNIFDLIGGM